MTTTTTTDKLTYATEHPRTRCGITAPGNYWLDLGYQLYSNTLEPVGTPDAYGPREIKDIDLLMARKESGRDDELALAWLKKYLDDRSAEKTRSTAIARAAEAGLKMADALQNIDARLRIYIGEEVRRALDTRRY